MAEGVASRVCSCCKILKPEADYYRRNHSQCRKCHYNDTNKRRKEKHRERKNQILDSKGRVCMHCQQTFPDICFDFHHVDPSQKEFQFNQLYAHSIEAIMVEIEKCILLCSNCHRIEHDRLRKSYGI